MPVHVEQMNTDIAIQSGNLPLTQEQIEMLVKLLITRLEHKQRNEQAIRDESRLRTSVLPSQSDI